MVTHEAATAADRSQVQLASPGALRLKALSREDCGRIHQASMELLGQTGVVVTSRKTQAVFAGHGARVDKNKNRVCLPPDLVEKALASVRAHRGTWFDPHAVDAFVAMIADLVSNQIPGGTVL